MEIGHVHLSKHLTSAQAGDCLKRIPDTPGLALVFAAPSRIQDAERIFSTLQNGGAQLLGCTTAGEIAKDGVFEDSFSITTLRFKHTGLRLATAPLENMSASWAAGAEIGRHLKGEEEGRRLSALLLLAPGVQINGSAVAQGLQSQLDPGVAVLGALAGDGVNFGCTYTMSRGLWGDRQLAAVGFYGSKLRVTMHRSIGWKAFGPLRRVTLAKDNVLYELDGKPALEVYSRYLADFSEHFIYHSQIYPLEWPCACAGRAGFPRAVLGVDPQEGSLLLAGEVTQGTYTRLMHADSASLLQESSRIAETMEPVAGACLGLVLGGVGRKLILGGRAEEEVEAMSRCLGESAVLTGFYGYGEIGPDGAGSVASLQNQTLILAVIQEVV